MTHAFPSPTATSKQCPPFPPAAPSRQRYSLSLSCLCCAHSDRGIPSWGNRWGIQLLKKFLKCGVSRSRIWHIPHVVMLVELRQVRKSAACCVNSCARHLDRGAVPSPPSFPPSASPSPSSSFGSQTQLLMKTRWIKKLSKDPQAAPEHSHVKWQLPPAPRSRFSLPLRGKCGADRGGLQKEPTIPHTKPPWLFKAPATATKTTNYCKTSLITFQVTFSPEIAKQTKNSRETNRVEDSWEFHESYVMLNLHLWSLFCSIAAWE